MPINQIEPLSPEKLENGEGFLDFLQSYYIAIWDSIRHKEDNIWRFVSFVAVGLGALIGLSTRLTQEGYLLIIAPFLGIISFYGVMVVIDGNVWFRRNLYIVNNCERFLFRNLKSRILRTHYFRDPIRWETMYRIHFIFFYSINVIVLILFIIDAFKTNAQNLLNGYCIFYFFLMFLIHLFNNMRNQEYFKFVRGCEPIPVKNTEGKIIESSEFSTPKSYFRCLTADFFEKSLVFELFLALPVIPIFVFYFIRDGFNTINSWLLLVLLGINLFFFIFLSIKKNKSIQIIAKLSRKALENESPVDEVIVKKEKIWNENQIYTFSKVYILINLFYFLAFFVLNLIDC